MPCVEASWPIRAWDFRVRRIRRPLPTLVAIPVTAVGGLILGASYPEPGLWFLAIPGILLMLWGLVGRSWWSALVVGFAGAVAFWLPLIDWLTLYLGPIPWLGLAFVMVAWMVLAALLMSQVLTRADTLWRTATQRVVFVPLIVAGIWTAREGIASTWPWGGFSWGRVAQSQASGFFGHSVAWLSTAGLSCALVWIAAVILVLLREERARWSWITPVAGIMILALVPPFPIASTGTLKVGAVQGNADAGLFSQHVPGDILNDHVQASQELIGQGVDVVVWPENGNDIDPLRDSNSAQVMDDITTTLDAPLVFGTITHPTQDTYFNSSLVWERGKGVVAQYDKIHPVPFAEYMPARDFFHLLVPDLVDLVTRDYSFGTRPNVVDVAGVPVGLSICFDITDDQQAYDLIGRGAQVIFAQTNNADFGKTDESLQQLEIARLRAIETGRTVVNISTVGVSAIIGPDGRTLDTIPRFTAGVMIDDVPLATAVTPAMAAGRAIEWGLSAMGLVGWLLVMWASWRQRTRQKLARA